MKKKRISSLELITEIPILVLIHVLGKNDIFNMSFEKFIDKAMSYRHTSMAKKDIDKIEKRYIDFVKYAQSKYYDQIKYKKQNNMQYLQWCLGALYDIVYNDYGKFERIRKTLVYINHSTKSYVYKQMIIRKIL